MLLRSGSWPRYSHSSTQTAEVQGLNGSTAWAAWDYALTVGQLAPVRLQWVHSLNTVGNNPLTVCQNLCSRILPNLHRSWQGVQEKPGPAASSKSCCLPKPFRTEVRVAQTVCKLLRSGSRPQCWLLYQAGFRVGNGYSMISIRSSSFDGRASSGTRFGSE